MARILLIGSDEHSRATVREAIRQLSHHEVVEEADGPAALRRAASELFDLILLDLALPGLDGLEVCRRLRGQESTGAVPVVFLTASEHQIQQRLQALDLGAADFIVQPVDRLELLARIGSVLRSKVLGDEVRRHNAELAAKVVERTRQLEELANELRIERDILRDTFDVFDEALLLFDADGRVQIQNTAGSKLLAGDSQGEGGGVDLTLAALAREAVAANRIRDRDLVHRGRHLDLRAYPSAGRWALVYVRDVTEERDEEIRRLQSEKLASIGMLATGVAHEINNPAAFVLANVDALSGLLRALDDKLKLDPQASRRLGLKDLLFEAMTIVQETKEGAARINRIARDLHSFARVDDGASTVAYVNAAIESALTMLRNELRYRAQVERDLRATRPVKANAARLGQVFLNLILNAAHALPEANLRRNRLWVRSYDREGHVVVEVEDNGAGIPPEVLPRIFDSFFTTKPPGVGTGLGLPISREIVRSLGGELMVESQPGQGALFRVKLAARNDPTTAERPRVTAPRVARRRRLVAIDDEALLLKAYRRMLIDHHDVETRLGAREAMRLFEEDRRFDVVLCDLQMPEMSGAELYLAVRQRWPDLAARFVFITGGAFSPEARRFLDESALVCIHKPFHVEELLDLIDTRAAALATADQDTPSSSSG